MGEEYRLQIRSCRMGSFCGRGAEHSVLQKGLVSRLVDCPLNFLLSTHFSRSVPAWLASHSRLLLPLSLPLVWHPPSIDFAVAADHGRASDFQRVPLGWQAIRSCETFS